VPEFPEAPPILVGQSARMMEVRRRIEKLGGTDSPVLLLGETGTGKEVAARAIHWVRRAGPFVPIDCSILGTLLESELFGHTRGAFTGAVASRPGLIESAEGGTAFFDEIGELALELQAKLLRVLQEKEVRPLGSNARRKASFRTIAATNRDLAREAERGTFRRDLYYRLNVVTLRLPPLRERREDIPELVEHFLAQHGSRHRISSELMSELMAYDWPGNVRELENAIERMVAFNSGPVLQRGDLPTALAGPRLPSDCELAAARAPQPGVRRLDEMEREAIVQALSYTNGDRSRAAELLGIGRTTLYRRMKAYGV
jgi:DNA-binding NtrC family response regulator